MFLYLVFDAVFARCSRSLPLSCGPLLLMAFDLLLSQPNELAIENLRPGSASAGRQIARGVADMLMAMKMVAKTM